MSTLVKSNTVTRTQLWRTLSHIHLNRKDTELLDMTRVRSHSYTSLRDVVLSGSLPPASSKHWTSQQLSSYHSLPNMRHVHMRNPLVEKAARAYLATATRTQHEHHHNNNGVSASFASFLKIVRFPFLSTISLLGGASAWFKQLTIKV